MKRLWIFLLLFLFCTSCSPPASDCRETRFLMDTVCSIRAGGNANEAVHAAFSKAEEIQKAVNLYDPASTVSRFNRAKAGEPVPLDPHTAGILATALPLCEASGGAFDLTVAPLSALWNFKEEHPAPPSQTELTQALSSVGYQYLVFDAEANTLTKTLDGVALDLGGAAKGYAVDAAAQILKEAGVPYAVLDFGGNIYVFGKNPSHPQGLWQIGIQSPNADPGSYQKTVTLKEGAVATSGTYQRSFTYEGTLYHHILDPKTGYPAESGLSSLSIRADSALVADCLSTACFVLGDGTLAEQFGGEMVSSCKK